MNEEELLTRIKELEAQIAQLKVEHREELDRRSYQIGRLRGQIESAIATLSRKINP